MKKLCPYNRLREVQHYEQFNEYAADGQQSGYSYTMTADFVPLPCAQENCGAWTDGRCGYSSIHIEDGR